MDTKKKKKHPRKTKRPRSKGSTVGKLLEHYFQSLSVSECAEILYDHVIKRERKKCPTWVTNAS